MALSNVDSDAHSVTIKRDMRGIGAGNFLQNSMGSFFPRALLLLSGMLALLLIAASLTDHAALTRSDCVAPGRSLPALPSQIWDGSMGLISEGAIGDCDIGKSTRPPT